jgi:polysaccharide export outer membrane protein
MRESNSSSAHFQTTRFSTRESLLLAALVAFCLSPVLCMGQAQHPVVAPMAQGAGDLGSSVGSSAPSPSSLASIGGLTDDPISAGEIVHVIVFNAPDFTVTSRVSESGDLPIPLLGPIHLEGLNSAKASELIASDLRDRNLMIDPQVTVTVDVSSSGITILGEVRIPGIYPPPGKPYLSDLIATAGGLTATTGRVIEISNNRTPEKTEDIPWDPTMRNTSNYDRPVHPGDRILVRSCGFAYVGGHVGKPGSYALCGVQQHITLSKLIALASGVTPFTSERHTYLIRTQPDGTKVVQELDLHKILLARAADPEIKEDDIVYVTPSTMKDVLNRAVNFALTTSTELIYFVHQ